MLRDANSVGIVKRLVASLAGLWLCCAAVAAAADEAPADGFVTGDWWLESTPQLWSVSGDGGLTPAGGRALPSLGFVDLPGPEDEVAFPQSAAAPAGVGGFVRLGPWSLDGSTEGESLLAVDPYAGLRQGGLDLGFGEETDDVDGDGDFVTPFVGARTVLQFTPRWSMTALGDVGSDFAWQAAGLVGYNFGLFADDDAKFMVGYRALYQDYSGDSDGAFSWDVTLHGPMTAFSLRF